ncbi:hypothetical protein [Actinomadura bangladeshensis]|uniref:Uncharacterized protein n=1 Tax=Actinomadura bangladeshensis TaxID=453573 RepID=A0A4R4N785_9ACTN|nr:hypothetical protein [Actinomadura bangladeshensis]TDC03133.1 hypothetical protein E1284_38720 [Actinomadura bangladeshensis]
MSAEPLEPPLPFSGPGRGIPRTIKSISERLPEDKRALFIEQVTTAEFGADLDEVMLVWWGQAVLAQDPGREKRLADARAGRNLVPLSEIQRRLERRDGAG